MGNLTHDFLAPKSGIEIMNGILTFYVGHKSFSLTFALYQYQL